MKNIKHNAIRMIRFCLFIPCFFVAILNSSTAFAQTDDLRATILNISRSIPAYVGVAIVNPDTGDTLSVNGRGHFPMQSVFKFHLALAVLRLVDEGKLSLEQRVHVKKTHYFNTWSVLASTYPNADMEATLRELLTWTVMNSDNIACDILFDLIGGPERVEEFINTLGISDIAIRATEREMHRAWSVQFKNWTTPYATAVLLKLFYEGKILSAERTQFLWQLMVDTPNAPNRLKGLLPEKVVVARKPGTGSHNKEGVLGAANDVGILVLPNGKKVIVAAFVTHTKESLPAAEKVIAEVSKAVYDHYQR